jgi:ribonucleoside-diphosphate reductase alpha chain
MTGDRQRLPGRRQHEIIEFEHDGLAYIAGVGRFADGSIAEIFLNTVKSGCAAETAARDAAIILSLALQYGCPLETVKRALTKLRDGAPAGPIGRALDLIVGNAG